jgi:hypothetical protein
MVKCSNQLDTIVLFDKKWQVSKVHHDIYKINDNQISMMHQVEYHHIIEFQ